MYYFLQWTQYKRFIFYLYHNKWYCRGSNIDTTISGYWNVCHCLFALASCRIPLIRPWAHWIKPNQTHTAVPDSYTYISCLLYIVSQYKYSLMLSTLSRPPLQHGNFTYWFKNGHHLIFTHNQTFKKLEDQPPYPVRRPNSYGIPQKNITRFCSTLNVKQIFSNFNTFLWIFLDDLSSSGYNSCNACALLQPIVYWNKFCLYLWWPLTLLTPLITQF